MIKALNCRRPDIAKHYIFFLCHEYVGNVLNIGIISVFLVSYVLHKNLVYRKRIKLHKWADRKERNYHCNKKLENRRGREHIRNLETDNL